MGKIPPLAHHRSVSVREKSSHSSPQLRRSASAYTDPVAIGSKGSIFSLVDRDTISTRSSNGAETAKSSHAWHNKLWIITRKTSANNQHHNTAKLDTVVESIQNTRVPKWKQFFRKLKGGGGAGAGAGAGGGGGGNNNISSNAKRGDYPNDDGGNGNGSGGGGSSSNNNNNNNAKIRDYLNGCSGNNDAKRRDYPNGDAPNGLHLPSLQPKEQPMSPIWERRNVAQISPLNLSHLYTSKIKREHAKTLPV